MYLKQNHWKFNFKQNFEHEYLTCIYIVLIVIFSYTTSDQSMLTNRYVVDLK